MKDFIVEGKCAYCDKMFKKSGISRHLSSHLKKLAEEQAAPKNSAFHLKVQAEDYFLQLLIDGNATLQHLDRYLRRIWLECCGHMSEFGYERWGENLPMNKKIRHLFEGGETIWYAYDFGSTTELSIKIFKRYPIKIKESILLLSRNEPLPIPCDSCNKKPAVQLCSVHWDGTATFFCKSCVGKHKKTCPDADYAIMDIVNSPRLGTCAYDGGSIDKERDGAASSL